MLHFCHCVSNFEVSDVKLTFKALQICINGIKSGPDPLSFYLILSSSGTLEV